ncbi:DNAJ heat shock N-terminal domain-containing protein-like [Rhynchospora pubera]|uniref:DNAJ heat shock N-terminal domain-containing protein-like n=1 Tax=Rhynchospora pubera TaxID=906938 RepID=A0AAV8CTC6_9POAL|nr:DNAJ heat shock N-terminal domain-containing protein-like [Rhynchospora pubera]
MEDKTDDAFNDVINEKLENHDYIGARIHLLETIKTFPNLENASEMLTICEILCSATTSGTGNEVDWYRVLQLLPIDGPATVEAQYRDMLSVLEPVIDDIPGARLALQFVKDAYNVISDPIKRSGFDAGRKHATINLKEICTLDLPSISGNRRKYLDLLHFDGEKNREVEIVPKRFCSDSAGNFECDQVWLCYGRCAYFVKYGRIVSVNPEQMLVMVNWYKPCPKSDNEKKWCCSGLPVACGEFVQQENDVVCLDGPTRFSQLLFSGYGCDSKLQVYPKKGEVWAIYKDWNFNWDMAILLKCESYLVEVITNFSEDFGLKVVYLTRVPGAKNRFQRSSEKHCSSISNFDSDFSYLIPADKVYMFSHIVPAFQSDGTFELDESAIPENLSEDFSPLGAGTGAKVSDPLSFNDELVNDCSYSNSTCQFSLRDFTEEQVWAVYSGPDSMPRSYVKIINIISETHVRVSFLEPHPMNNEEIQWIEDDFLFSSGVFRKSADTYTVHMSNFSHVVKCDWSAKKSYYRIYPRKGEVWAISKSRGMKLNKAEYYRDEFRMVEILSDYISEERRINVGSLTEVDGSLTFYQRQFHDGFRLTKWVTRSEMLGFSHRVPAYRVTGHEGQPGLPEVMFQLEPAALPLPQYF